MLIKVKKCLIYGLKEELKRFLKTSQKAGFVEFIHPSLKRIEMPSLVKDIVSSIKILKKYPFHEMKREEETSLDIVASHIVSINNQLEHLREEEKALLPEINRVMPLGDFSKEDIEYLEKEANRIVQFFCIKTSNKKGIKIPKELIYINTEYDLDYYISISKERKLYPNMVEMIVEKPLGELNDRLFLVRNQIQEKETDIKELTSYIPKLKEELSHQLNHANLENVKKSTAYPMDNPLFFIEAWIPISHIEHFEKIISPMTIEYEYISVEKHEKIPTYMENKGPSKIGEDLVKIYDIPSVYDHDPSIWVFLSFAIFFAIIISDAGYGFLYLLLAIFLKWKIPNPKAFIRRFIKLIYILSFCCITWGVLTGSYFGISVNLDAPLNNVTVLNYLAEKKADYHLKVKDDVYDSWIKKYPNISYSENGLVMLNTAVSDDNKYEMLDTFKNNILMEISILIGVVHIALSLLRTLKRNWAGIGWVIFMIGAYLYFPSIIGATSMLNFLGLISKNVAFSLGNYLLYSGIIIAVVLALVQKRLRGIPEIMNVIQIFSDVLSYLRLYALGLAGMIMSVTVNEMSKESGVIVGVFIIIVGHSINILIGIMGGVIHGLRLNFIEWYHYCFEGDGKLFNPLRLLK